MQGALDPASFKILGLNESGYESGNDSFCEGRDLPWLQDTDVDGVWESWGVVYRDVVILDPDGSIFDAYNLSDHDLGDAEYFNELQGLIEAAGG